MKKLALILWLVTSAVPAAEPELFGFIVDSTITRTGHEFYRMLSERLNDSSELDFNLVVRERPSARWGILIWVEHDGEVVYRRFLQPNTADMRDIGYQAADAVSMEIESRKIQSLFDINVDLARDEL